LPLVLEKFHYLFSFFFLPSECGEQGGNRINVLHLHL